MKQSLRLASLAVIGLTLGLGAVSAVSLPRTAIAAESETVRPEVGKPLQAAQDLIKQQKYKDALAKLHELDSLSSLTPFEAGLAAQLKGLAAQGAGDYAGAARSFETYLASAKLPPEQSLRLTQAVASLYYQAKDYDKAAAWVNRYTADGGTDPQTRNLLAQSYYLAENYPEAAKALAEQIKSAEAGGHGASEQQYQLLANIYAKSNDQAGYRAAIEKLVAYYPKADYWSDLLRRTTARSGFADRLQLDALRLSLAVGTLNETADYLDLAQLALQAGLPGEAKSALDKGYAKGVLGKGAEADRHQRLRDLANKKVTEDLKTIAATEQEAAAAKDGTGLVNTGLAYLGYGKPDKAVALIEQGIQKGGLKYPDDARLHLGLAYLAAGQKDKAAQTFKSIQGTDGSGDLARLWGLTAGHIAS